MKLWTTRRRHGTTTTLSWWHGRDLVYRFTLRTRESLQLGPVLVEGTLYLLVGDHDGGRWEPYK